MKTSIELQRQSYFRKLTYFGVILFLFTVMTFFRSACEFVRNTFAKGRASTASPGLVERVSDRLARMTVSRQARTLQLNESDQGEADLAGSTARLSLSGARGFAICFLWISANEKQKKHEWNSVELLVNTVTKLQPHFLTPWLFQSWNLSYNVSVEADRVRDKYYYISKGISLLADGERINQFHGIDGNGQAFVVGNPDMRFWIAFYYSNKFGTSDEQHTLRSLYQMSCLNPEKRDPKVLRPDGRSVDLQAFREFVEQNPRLVRRLRDNVNRCQTPDEIVDFLADNTKIPIRHELSDDRWVLKRRGSDQFPVFPDNPAVREVVSPYAELDGTTDSYHASWAWHVHAQDPLPKPIYGKPSAAPPAYDPLRHRMARAPAWVIFCQQPARSRSYIAERLLKEGWFDDAGWNVDEGRQSNRWFEEPVVVGKSDRFSSQLEWKQAHDAWNAIGREHGYLLTEAEKRNLEQTADLFTRTYDMLSGNKSLPVLTEDQVSPEMWRSYDAYLQILHLGQNFQMTNFKHHLYRAEAEKDERTVRARRLLYQADRLRRDAGNPEAAIRRYEEGFRELVGDRAANRQGVLEVFPDFRRDSVIQEDLLEKQFAFLGLLENHRSARMRTAISAPLAVIAWLAPCGPLNFQTAMLYQFVPRPQELPSLFQGPLDGVDSGGVPWVTEANVVSVKSRLGLLKTPSQPPAGVAPQSPQRPPQ